MLRYLARRAIEAVPVLFGISIVGFLIVRLAPGDPASLLADVTQLTPEQQHAYRVQLGLEDPLPVQYARMLLALLTVTGVACGALAAWKPRTFADTLVTVLALFGLSLPQFWLGLMLITVFAAN